MSISNQTLDNEKAKFKEASTVSGQPGIVVVNPDGTIVGQAYAFDEDNDAFTAYIKGANYTTLSASGIVANTTVSLYGYFINASSSGVISLYDNASAASGTAMMALNKPVTIGDFVMLSVPIILVNGCYFSLVSGTATVAVLTGKVTAQ